MSNDIPNLATVSHLEAALDHLLAVRAAWGLPPVEPPAEALDVALSRNRACQESRIKVKQALEALSEAGVGGGLVLLLEEVVDGAAVAAADAGFRLGSLAGGASPQRPEPEDIAGR